MFAPSPAPFLSDTDSGQAARPVLAEGGAVSCFYTEIRLSQDAFVLLLVLTRAEGQTACVGSVAPAASFQLAASTEPLTVPAPYNGESLAGGMQGGHPHDRRSRLPSTTKKPFLPQTGCWQVPGAVAQLHLAPAMSKAGAVPGINIPGICSWPAGTEWREKFTAAGEVGEEHRLGADTAQGNSLMVWLSLSPNWS